MKYVHLKKELFNKTTKTLENSYNSLVLLTCYCKQHEDIEEISIITPLINSIFQAIDSLNANFISLEDN